MSTKKTQTLKTEAAGEFSFELSKFITFRDGAACDRVRRIKKAEITKHPNPRISHPGYRGPAHSSISNLHSTS